MAEQVYTSEENDSFTQKYYALGHGVRKAIGLLHVHREKARGAAFCHGSVSCPISVVYSVAAGNFWTLLVGADREVLSAAGWTNLIYHAFLDWFDLIENALSLGKAEELFLWAMSQETLPQTA